MAARSTVRTLSATAGAVALLFVLGACGGADAKVVGFERNPPLRVGGQRLPDVSTDRPAQFAFRAQPGHVLIAYFGYTSCPDVCPTTLADVRDALEALGSAGASRVDLAMTTVDPERDTAAVLRGYLGSFFGDGRAHVLRTVDAVRLRRAEDAFLATSSVTRSPDGAVEVAHSGTIYAVDAAGRVRIEWAFGTQAEDLASDLRILLSRVGEPR